MYWQTCKNPYVLMEALDGKEYTAKSLYLLHFLDYLMKPILFKIRFSPCCLTILPWWDFSSFRSDNNGMGWPSELKSMIHTRFQVNRIVWLTHQCCKFLLNIQQQLTQHSHLHWIYAQSTQDFPLETHQAQHAWEGLAV